MKNRVNYGKHIVSFFIALLSCALPVRSGAEEIRVAASEIIEISKDKPQGVQAQLSYNDAVFIVLDKDTRFLRGIELELSAPQSWLNNQGTLAIVIYSGPGVPPFTGAAQALQAKQLMMEALSNKIQTVYQIPLKRNHNLRTTPYASVLPNEVLPRDFPVIFRLMPITRGTSEEIQNMRFQLSVKPLLSDEGAVKINIRYPSALQNKPYTTLIDDRVIEHPEDEHILREGEHHLMIISSDYRNESRRFILERGKTADLNITLQDLTPLIVFETPDNAKIFLDDQPFTQSLAPKPIEPGPHEVKIQVSDYTIIKSINVRKGKTYRIAFIVDLDVSEEN
jgi:hypothetical protein